MTDAQLMYEDARIATGDDGRGPLETDLTTGQRGAPEPSSGLPISLGVYEERDSAGVVNTHSPYATTVPSLAGSIPRPHHLLPVTGSGIPVALAVECRPWVPGQARAVGAPEVLPDEGTDRLTRTCVSSNAGAGR